MKHFPSLAPGAIEEEHVPAWHRIGWVRSRQCLAARMKNQKLFAGSDRVGWKTSCRVGSVFALIDVGDRIRDCSSHELPSARRLAMLVPVDQHVHMELRLD